MPQVSRKPRTARAKKCGSYGAPTGLTESPKPGRSMASTRYRSASAATVGRNEAFVPPSPWSITTGKPSPARATAISPSEVRTRAISSRPGSVMPEVAARETAPRGRGVRRGGRPPPAGAALRPPAAEAVHAPPDVAANALPGRAVGAQPRVGPRARRRTLELAETAAAD